MAEHGAEHRAEAERRRGAGRDLALRPRGVSWLASRAERVQWLDKREDSVVLRRRAWNRSTDLISGRPCDSERWAVVFVWLF
eukprot:211995-Alexandrium_andersonii.AAC.1